MVDRNNMNHRKFLNPISKKLAFLLLDQSYSQDTKFIYPGFISFPILWALLTANRTLYETAALLSTFYILFYITLQSDFYYLQFTDEKTET